MDTSLVQYFHTPSEDFLHSSVYITWAGHRHCTPSHQIGPRVMDAYKLVFVLSGKGYLKQGSDHTISLTQGDMFVLFPRERHQYYADEEHPWELMWVSFNGELCKTILDSLDLTLDNYILNNALTHSIQRTLQTLINSLGDTSDTNRLCATGQLYMLLAYIKQIMEAKQHSTDQPKQNPCVWKAIRFIEQNYYLNLDVEMLCKHVNYSRSYLSRIFKNEMQMTIPEYTNMIRIQNAKTLLIESDMPMREISTSVGINDSFYFSKLFKKFTGQTPRDFRQGHKQQ